VTLETRIAQRGSGKRMTISSTAVHEVRSAGGRSLYFSSQRGTTGSSSGSISYEVTGPFRTSL
jgi:hypothetical protein